MSDEKMIAAVRRVHDAANRGDFDAAVHLAHPDIEIARTGDQSPLNGIDALREWLEPDAIEEPRVEPLDFSVNGNKVLVREHVTARGASSGIEMDFVSPWVWTLDDDGLVKRVDQFLPHQEAEALEAAGLSE